MRRRSAAQAWVLGSALVVALAGCGGSGGSGSTTRASVEAGPISFGDAELYASPEWGVVLDGGKAEVLRKVGGRWTVDRSHGVSIGILGPQPGKVAPNPPQVAVALKAKAPIEEAALWLDGSRLIEKGGGSPTDYTMYGAPNRLDPGTHTAVAYARTAAGGTAIAWRFRLR